MKPVPTTFLPSIFYRSKSKAREQADDFMRIPRRAKGGRDAINEAGVGEPFCSRERVLVDGRFDTSGCLDNW